MIELAHMATGVIAGSRCNGPADALLAGIVAHALGDITPHGEVDDRPFEIGSTVVGLSALAARHGLRSPVFWGAVGSVLPDGEHVLPSRIRPRTALFPTHRFAWLHSNGPLAIPAWVQVVAGGAVVGAFVARRRRLPEPASSRLLRALRAR